MKLTNENFDNHGFTKNDSFKTIWHAKTESFKAGAIDFESRRVFINGVWESASNVILIK